VIRERIGQAALRTYPPAARQTRGLEMLGMLLDAGEQSDWVFVRDSGSLVLGGLRERRAIIARAGSRRLIADSCCKAVLIWLMLLIISRLNTQASAGPSQQLLIQEGTLAAILSDSPRSADSRRSPLSAHSDHTINCSCWPTS
jgi:hypothetical protein